MSNKLQHSRITRDDGRPTTDDCKNLQAIVHRPSSIVAVGVAAILILLTLSPHAAMAQDRYAVLIGGLGGSPEYTEAFQQYLFETRRALVDELAFPAANVTVLAEQAISGEAFVNDVATAENIRTRFEALAGQAGADDEVFVVLFGHGSYDGENAQLNIPRRDLNDTDYAALIDALPAQRVVFVNTASASGPFAEALSAPDRIVITATQRGTQRNETTFPQFFVEALTNPAADLDKNGDLSVREVFQYAAEATARAFEEDSALATEFALLEDTGDTEAFRVEDLEANGEGNLAAITYFRRGGEVLASLSEAEREAAAPLLRERSEIERAVAALKSRKNTMNEDAYYDQLEVLFVRLARLNDQIEAGQ